MDEHLKSILQSAVESDIPSVDIELWPEVKERLVAKKYPTFQQKSFMNSALKSHRQVKLALFIVLAVAVLLIGIAVTPQGRAFAQTIVAFFTRTTQESFPLSYEQLNALYTPIPQFPLQLVAVTPQALLSVAGTNCADIANANIYECQIKQAETQLGFDIKEFLSVPDGWAFVRVRVFKELRSADISYEIPGAYLDLQQGLGEFPSDTDWSKVPASAVEAVQVGLYPGEYVRGHFIVKNGDKQATWDSGTSERLRWREGEMWFEIDELNSSENAGYLNKNALVALATSMVYSPKQAIPVDFRRISSIPLAEQVTGHNIKESTLLPNEFYFDYVTYDPQFEKITLSYFDGGLQIIQTPKKTSLFTDLASYKNVETVQIGNHVGQYAVASEEVSIWESATPPSFQTDNSYQILLWQQDDMVYQIMFYPRGYMLTKEQLIQIAESLR